MSLVPKHIKNLLPYKPGKRIDDVKNQYVLKLLKYIFNKI